jgi:CHAD domain-containing protein
MRVATRRLRAALSLFAGVLPVRAQVFHDELGWLGRLLGSVRDLDVQLEGLAGMDEETAAWRAEVAAAGDRHDPLADLSELLHSEREAARAALLGGLDSMRWERLAKGLSAMAQQGPARRSVATRTPAVIGLPELVLARHDKVAKAAKKAKRTGVVADFHRLRIRCKRLRYSLEFAAEVYEGRTARYVRRLTAVQDELGLMQDAEVASLRLAELATGDTALPAATVFVMGGVAERHRRDVDRYLRRLPQHASRVGGRAWRDLLDHMAEKQSEAEAAQPPVRRTLRAVPAPAPDATPTAPPAATGTPGQAEHGAGHPSAGGGFPTHAGPQAVRPSGQRE